MNNGELQTVPIASLEDLDLDAFETFIESHAPGLAADEMLLEDALTQFRLAGTMGNRYVPTMAGLYLFGTNPQFMLPQSALIAAKFAGTELTDDVVVRQHIGGNVFELFERGMAFVHAEGRQLVNQLDPDENSCEFPTVAVKEALINALVHRDLRAGSPCAIRLFTDRIEIWSPGGSALAQPLRHYASRGGTTLPRNPVVAMVTRLVGLSEQLGRGLPQIRKAVETIGTPEFESTKESVTITIPSAFFATNRSAAN